MSTRPDTPGVTSDLLRSVIREVLNDVVAGEVAAATGSSRPLPSGTVVRIASQADLDAAVRRILADARDPQKRADLESGRVRFRLAAGRDALREAQPAVARGGSSGAVAHRVDKGPLTERHVIAAARDTTVIIIGERVVVTPLARERARSAGVEIRRER